MGLTDELSTVIDASERVLALLESTDDVAYAEIGGVVRDVTDVVVTRDAVQSASDMIETGVWWRLFANGVADYRYTTSFTDDHLQQLVERSIHAATVLAQTQPAQYDQGTIHQATHPGWATENTSLHTQTATEKGRQIRRHLSDGVAAETVDRINVTYRDAHTQSILMTTTGTTVQTTEDRASMRTILALPNSAKLTQHTGTTTGASLLDSIERSIGTLIERSRSMTTTDQTTSMTAGEVDVVIGPAAAAEVCHQLAHYLETDIVYFGSSPLAIGDRVAPSMLSIADTVPPGSWASRAYDAEGRATHASSLVIDGIITNQLHNTTSAIEAGTFPAGHAIPSLGLEQPPRIHARHVDVAPGDSSLSELCAGADLYVERFGKPRLKNDATRTKRQSRMPPSVLYAKDIGKQTPDRYGHESDNQTIRFPIEEGYTLDAGEATARVCEHSIEFTLDDLQSLAGLSCERETLTGTCTKHKSHLPYAVTAPAFRLTTTLRPD